MKSINSIKSLSVLLLLSFTIQSCVKDYDNPANGTPGPTITLFALKQSYQGNSVTLTTDVIGGASKIQGIVISDKNGGNVEPGTFILQETFPSANTATDVTRGIVIKTTGSENTLNFGDSLVIDVIGTTLDRINGTLTLSGLAPDKITVGGTNKTPLLRFVTQAILGVYIEQYESTLIALNADVADYAAGTTFAGLRKLNDKSGGKDLYVKTRTEATFASTQLPMNALFTGIAGFLNETGKDTTGAKHVIIPRNAADIQFLSGVIYPGFPENFETPDATTKASYNSGTNIITTATGNWYLLQAILGNTLGSDKFNVPGKQNVRIQQNLTTSGYVQMNFDVPDGASKVSVFYAKYATDAKSTFRLESSVNGGTTWLPVGANVTDVPDKGSRIATWSVNFTGPVRFRINKLGTGTSNNGRLGIDDFTVYKKL